MITPLGGHQREASLEAVAVAVGTLTEGVFRHLDALASHVSDFELADALAHGQLADKDVSRLEELAVRIIEDVDLVIGAGMAATPSDLTGAGLMHWWVSLDGEVLAKRHVRNPRSDSYYDFSNSRWFQRPVRLGVATLIAPYVDSWGTDDLTVTAAIPIRLDDQQVTVVVAADLNAREYVQAAEQLLRPIGPAVLVDAEGRAVASTVPEIETGVRLGALEAWATARRADIPSLQWHVALPARRHEDS